MAFQQWKIQMDMFSYRIFPQAHQVHELQKKIVGKVVWFNVYFIIFNLWIKIKIVISDLNELTQRGKVMEFSFVEVELCQKLEINQKNPYGMNPQ